MEVTNLTDAKNRLSELVEKVRAGERVRILVRGVAAADIVPVSPRGDDAGDARAAELERRGLVRKGTGRRPAWIGSPVPTQGGLPGSQLINEEREDRF